MEYRHGGDIYGENKIILDFSVNTNPLSMPESVKREVLAHPEDFCRYPDSGCRKLRQALSGFYENQYGGRAEFSPEDFICGNGAADILYSLVFAMRPKKALLCEPTFGEYEEALKAAGCEIVKIDRGEDGLPPEDLDMVILCNPNNPTGSVFSQSEMKKWLDFCGSRGIFLVIDECFNWFLSEPEKHSVASRLGNYENVFLLNAFTKIYAMAGLRLGYGICKNKNILKRIEGCRQPWSVSGAAMRGGIEALKDLAFLERTRETVAKERSYLTGELEKLGFEVFPSEVNFLLFRCRDGVDYYGFCRQRGILIRSCHNFDGLDYGCYRVGVKLRKENEALLACLAEGRKSGGKGNYDTGDHVKCRKESSGGGTLPDL